MKKILIIHWVPLSKRKIEIYQIKKLKKKYKIFTCDIQSIIFPKMKTKKLIKLSNEKKINNFKDFYKFFKQHSFDLIINHTGLSKKNEIYKFLLKLKIPILTFYEDQISDYSFFPKNIYFFLKKFYYQKIFDFFKAKNKYEFSYVMSNENTKINDIVGTNIIHGKNFILHEKTPIKRKVISKKRLVFLDQNWGNNQDYKRKNSANNLKNFKKKFYPELINFLKNLEKEYKKKVLILLHPMRKKSDQNFYKNFKSKINKTSQEIYNSDIVIGFWSLALNYGIIYNKKMLLLNSNQLKIVNNFHFSKYIPRWLKVSKPLNLSNKEYYTKNEMDKYIIKPDIRYKNFKKNFLVSSRNNNYDFLKVVNEILN
jgi:hypothetical protein